MEGHIWCMLFPGGSFFPLALRPLTQEVWLAILLYFYVEKAEEMQSHEYADKERSLGGFIHPGVQVKDFCTVTQWSSCSQQCSRAQGVSLEFSLKLLWDECILILISFRNIYGIIKPTPPGCLFVLLPILLLWNLNWFPIPVFMAMSFYLKQLMLTFILL